MSCFWTDTSKHVVDKIKDKLTAEAGKVKEAVMAEYFAKCEWSQLVESAKAEPGSKSCEEWKELHTKISSLMTQMKKVGIEDKGVLELKAATLQSSTMSRQARVDAPLASAMSELKKSLPEDFVEEIVEAMKPILLAQIVCTDVPAQFKKMKIAKAELSSVSAAVEAEYNVTEKRALVVMATASALQVLARGSVKEASEFPAMRLKPTKLAITDLPQHVQEALQTLALPQP